MSQEKFLKKCKEIWGDRYDYGNVKYVNNHTKINIICPKHGEFFVSPKSFISNSKKQHLRGCPQCALENRTKTTEEFIEQARKVHGDKYDYSKVNYVNKNVKVCIICLKHGEFWQNPFNHIKGNCCPHCSSEMNVYETRLFDKLYQDFPHLEWVHSFRNREMFGRLEFDIYSPKYKIAVEYQGPQHFHPVEFYGGEERYKTQTELDKMKREICNENKILLLEFSYDKKEKQNNLITDYYELKHKINKWLENF